jgi:Trk K+ transport system NAD-binding subunit
VAHSLDIRHAVAYMNLSATSGIARMAAPASTIGRTLAEIEEASDNVCIILVLRGNLLMPRPPLDTTIREGDIVLVAGLDEAIDAFADS